MKFVDEILDNDSVGEIPVKFKIDSAYPNPFNPSININILMDLTSDVNISIVDVNGRLI